MLKKYSYVFILFSFVSFSQTITIDDENYTAADLANLLLEGSCITPNNISHSSSQAVAKFDSNGSTFPIAEGIILRTGIAKNTEGIYTNTNLSSQLNSNSDSTLQTISESTGQDEPITDTTFLEFDFVTISSDFSFNFIFASNEYGQWQCGFSDVFAFILTDLDSGVSENLALVPGTPQPITVITIRDNTYNENCTSENSNLFDTYNETNSPTSTLNMRGHTTILNASSTLTPGKEYRIRLVIGDYKNPNFDSAVFIDTGSFTTEIDLGEDRVICDGNEITIATGLDNSDYSHTWTLNGDIIIGETSNSLLINEIGIYNVIATKNGSSCEIPGTVTVNELSFNSPNNLIVCDSGAAFYEFNLSANNTTSLNLDENQYEVVFFASPFDITNNIPIEDINSYESPGNNEIIYIKILNILTGNYCTTELSFNLSVSEAINSIQPSDINICESINSTFVDLTIKDNEILNGLDPTVFSVIYYASENDLNNQNSLNGSIDIPSQVQEQEIFVLIVNSTNTNCFDTTSFNIRVNELPLVSSIEDIVACSEYTLPEIDDGIYYDGPNGTGNMLSAGDILENGGTYYIYSGPDVNGCFNESSFILTLIDEYTTELHHCEEFSVPIFPPGNFYTETDGPNGLGTLINPSVIFTSDDLPLIVHYYAETIDENTMETSVCRNESFNITIYDLPLVDIPDNTPIVTCLNYTLPDIDDINGDGIVDGEYFDNFGNLLNIGDIINNSGTYIVQNSEIHEFINSDLSVDSITCTYSEEFEIIIVNEPIDEIACGSFTLPALDTGNYYLEPNGEGTSIPQNTDITYSIEEGLIVEGISTSFPSNTIDIYVYASDTENTPNCTNNLFFKLIINPIPKVDTPSNEIVCVTEGFLLPSLSNGNYFDGPNGTGNMYFATDIINTIGTTTLYVYNTENSCSNEWSFEIEVRGTPLVDNFTDVYSCSPYELPVLNNGNYYTQPNGQGTMLLAGDIIGQETEAGTISNMNIPLYIYNEWNDLEGCFSEKTFSIYVLGINLGDFENINVCDSHTLAELNIGNYYSLPGGNSADLITNLTYDIPGTYTIYVYEENGIRDPDDCIAEKSFVLTISETPTLDIVSDKMVCYEYYLPELSNNNYDINYYTDSGGNPSNIIDTNTPRTNPNESGLPFTETIYIYASSQSNPSCYDEQSFELSIYPRLELDIDDAIICVDLETGIALPSDYITLESGVNPNRHIVNWYFNGNLVHTGTNYTAEQAGEYTIETTVIGEENFSNCNYNSKTITVFTSSVAEATYTITDDFENTASVIINITNGNGVYQYQLDDGTYQDSNKFTNVTSGEHIVTITDMFGNCGSFVLNIIVLKYPKFFTPNGDGINDYWNIINLSNQPNSTITIFDRFGKFITQIKPSETGWDGTYNNRQLPSTDYWFIVNYLGLNQENKEFRAHFSLKR
ncbi:T9SS type B sorting domain-containing protein [Flavobacteriaceae bacterium]|nr:T9SS type B sorting domain-containing protein [Flavobacteriaceae bacterium]